MRAFASSGVIGGGGGSCVVDADADPTAGLAFDFGFFSNHRAASEYVLSIAAGPSGAGTSAEDLSDPGTGAGCLLELLDEPADDAAPGVSPTSGTSRAITLVHL